MKCTNFSKKSEDFNENFLLLHFTQLAVLCHPVCNPFYINATLATGKGNVSQSKKLETHLSSFSSPYVPRSHYCYINPRASM